MHASGRLAALAALALALGVGFSRAEDGGGEGAAEYDEFGNPKSTKVNMGDMMQQGRVTRWWWDVNSPAVTTVNDKTFDDFVALKDFVMIEFFLPTCQHCNSIAPIYNRIATSMKTERRDIEFARVNCGKDQSVRPPTAEEMEVLENGNGVPNYPRGKKGSDEDKIKYDGEIVCEWYNMKDMPALLFFRPGYENPKFVDVVTMTHDEVIEWVEAEIGVIRGEQGKDLYYQGEAAAEEEKAPVQGGGKFKSREDVLKFLNKGGAADGAADPEAPAGCEALAAENKELRAANKKLKAAIAAVQAVAAEHAEL